MVCGCGGELAALPGIGGELVALPSDLGLTDPETARSFVKDTGIDALAVNLGQAHLYGRAEVRLNLSSLADLKRRYLPRWCSMEPVQQTGLMCRRQSDWGFGRLT